MFGVETLLWLASIGVVLIGGVVAVKVMAHQWAHDHSVSYLVTLPRDLDDAHVVDFVRGLSGLTIGKLKRLGGLLCIAFEIEKDETGIKYRLTMPQHVATYMVGLVRSHIPGVHLEPEEPQPKRQWTAAVELGMTSAKPLRISSPEAVVKTILAAFTAGPGEIVLMQWVIAPAWPEAPNPQDKSHKEKHSDHTFLAVGRIAARAQTFDDAKRLMRRVYVALSSTKAYGVGFRTRMIPRGVMHNRIHRHQGSVTFPCYLNATELATLIAWPIGSPAIPGLPMGRTRQLVADAGIPTKGIVVARSNFSGAERFLAVNPVDLTRHVHVIGSTGTGKSTAIENQGVQLMQAGYGLCFIDPHGDSFHNLTNRIPPSRYKDVVIFDLTDSSRPIGFNVLEGDPYMTTNQMMAVFDRLYDIYRMPQTADILRSTVLALSQLGMTLLDIPAFLSPTENGQLLRDKYIRRLEDPALRDFLRQYNALKPERKNEAIAPVLRRLRPFETWPSLRGTLGQTRSGINLSEAIRTRKIILLNLSKGQIGEEETKLFGSLFVSRFISAIQRRAEDPPEQRTPYFLFIDEFQNYVNLPVNFGDVLAEARKYGLGFIIAHQHMAQLPGDLREAVMPNARNKLVFQTSMSDASILAREMPQLKADDFQNLGQYEVIARLTVADRVMPPATGRTLAPAPATGSANAVRSLSAARYGRSLAEVEAELSERHKAVRRPVRAVFGREEDDPTEGEEEAS